MYQRLLRATNAAALAAALLFQAPAAMAQSGTTGIEGQPAPTGRVMSGYRSSTGTATAVQLDAGGRVPVATTPAAGTTQAVNVTQVLGVAHSATNPLMCRLTDGTSALTPAEFDFDTGAGTATRTALGIALPGAGGPVAGGTSTNPVRTDPTGTTTQPISAAALPLPAGAATEVTLLTLGTQATLATRASEATVATLATEVTTGAINTKLVTADLDPGAGTATRLPVGLLVAKTGGPALVGAGADGDAVPVDVESFPDNEPFNLAQVAGAATAAGIGAATASTLRVTVATDDSVTVDAPAGTPVFVRPSDGAAAQTFGTADADTGAPDIQRIGTMLLLPGAGGPAAGGTATAPLRTDPTGTTPQPASQSGTWTVQPGNTANTTPWLASVAQGGNTATVTAGSRLSVDGSGVTQPVSGTVTANAGTGTFNIQATAVSPAAVRVSDGAAFISPATDRTTAVAPFSVRVTNDGASFSTLAIDRTSAVSPAATRLADGASFYVAAKTGQLPAALVSDRLDVNIGASAATVTTDSELPGAGVLADAAVNPTTPMVGANLLTYNGATWDRARGDTANGLDVDVTRFPDNEPFNLAQVNGSAITVGSGVVTANTQRVTLATDDTVTTDGTVTARTSACTAADTDQVAVDATADAVGDLANRDWIRVTNFSNSANAVFCGPTAGLADTNGERLDAGQSTVYETGTLAWSCITAAAGSATVSVFECDEP